MIQCIYGWGLHSPHPWKWKLIAQWREVYPSCGTGTTHRKVRKVTGTRDTAWPVAWGWKGTEVLGKFSWMGQQLLIITNCIVILARGGLMKTLWKRKWCKILVQEHTRRTRVPSWSRNHFSMITNPKHMHCEEGGWKYLHPTLHFYFSPNGLCLMVKDTNLKHKVNIVLL